jgi:hypothetical protein
MKAVGDRNQNFSRQYVKGESATKTLLAQQER